MLQGELDWKEIRTAIMRQKSTAISVFLLIVVLTWIALLAWPRAFSSEAKMFIRVGRESVSLDPTASVGQTVMLQKTQDEEVNAALDILNSRYIRERVVDEVGVDIVLNGPAAKPGAGNAINSSLANLVQFGKDAAYFALDLSMIRDETSDREKAVQKLEDWISIYAPKRSTVISVYCESKSPELAQIVAQKVVDCYMEEHVRIRESSSSLEFFVDKCTKLEEELKQREEELQIFKEEHSVMTLTASQSLIGDRRVALTSQLETSQAELERCVAREAALKNQLEGFSHHSMRPKIEAELMAEQVNHKGIAAQIEQLRGQIDEVLNEQEQLGKDEKRLLYLQRLHDIAESNYFTANQKLEEARINSALDARQISNVTLVQPATFVEKPVSPKKPLIVVAALLLALIASPAAALLRDASINPTRDIDHVERIVGVPVAATIPVRQPGEFELGMPWESKAGCLRLVQFMQSSTNQESIGSVGLMGCRAGIDGAAIAEQLARICSNHYRLQTLLIDADRNQRKVANSFNLNGAPGLSELSAKRASVTDCLQPSGMSNLDIISPSSPYSAEVFGLNREEFSECLDDLKSRYACVIVDLPPPDSDNPELHVCSLLDSVFVITEQEKTALLITRRLVRNLEAMGTEVRGIVLLEAEK